VLSLACRTLASAQEMASTLPRATPIALDVLSPELETQVTAHDVVISLIPYVHHATVIEAAIKGKTHVITTSYISPAMRALDEKAKEAGIVVMNEIGLDPGIDHLYAVKTIDEVHEKGGKVGNRMLYGNSWF
jgi:saccharopine dehydrogenase-like NADP-dependent oxidoreductase